MKLWITGANGLLGKAVQRICKKKGIDCVISSKEDVDISSADQVFRFTKTFHPTHIVNCAALAHVDLAEKNPDAAFQVNALGPENLGKTAHSMGIPIVHISTEYIFNGNLSDTPFNENDTPCPVGVYATTKYEGERRLLEECPTACIIRASWLFGGNGKTFLSSLFERMKTEKTFHIAADQKGRATYVDDLIQAIFSLFGHSGIFHYANQGEASRYEIALAIKETALEHKIPICCDTIMPTEVNAYAQLSKRPYHCILDTAKFEHLFQAPIRSWKEAVRDFIHRETPCR